MNANKPKIKNLRALLSSNTNKKDIMVNSNRSSLDKDQEISFNITPEEEELKKQIMNINNSDNKRNPTLYTEEDHFNYESLESEVSRVNLGNNKLKNDAKDLIEKTKKIIDNLDSGQNNQNMHNIQNANKKKFNTTRNSSNNLARNDFNDFIEEDNNKYNLKEEYEENTPTEMNNNTNPKMPNNVIENQNNKKDKHYNNLQERSDILYEDTTIKEPKIKRNNDLDDEVILKNHITLNTNAINQRLLEKIKTIKNMEKEQKEKNQTIESLRNKVERQKEEIIRLNEQLLENNSKSWKIECNKLQERFNKYQAETKDKISVLENLINSYKNQLEALLDANDLTEKKCKEYEKKLKDSEFSKENLEIQTKNYKNNFENEMKEKGKNKVLIEKFRQLLGKLNTFYKDNNLIKTQNLNFIDKLKYYFEPEREETECDVDKNKYENNNENNTYGDKLNNDYEGEEGYNENDMENDV